MYQQRSDHHGETSDVIYGVGMTSLDFTDEHGPLGGGGRGKGEEGAWQ